VVGVDEVFNSYKLFYLTTVNSKIIRYLVNSELGECGLVTSSTMKVFSWREREIRKPVSDLRLKN
jgi:hypothetical protein